MATSSNPFDNSGKDWEAEEFSTAVEDECDVLSDTSMICDNMKLVERFYFFLEDGNQEALEDLILRENLDVNLLFHAKFLFVKRKYHGWRALHIVALNNKVKLARFLLHEGADVNSVTPDGETALHLAVKNGAADIVSLLLECNVFLRDRPNNQGATALLKAIVSYRHAFKGNYRRCVSLLLGAGCNPNIPASSLVTPLHVAVDQGDPILVQYLLNAGANVNVYCDQRISPLLRALIVKYVNSELVTSLLEAGADTSVKLNGRSVLHIAVSRCDDRIIEKFLNNGADPNGKDNVAKTPLWLAVEEDNIKVVPILVSGGADVNYLRQPQYLSILSLAITNNSLPMVKLLLELDASTFTETIMWSTPLHLAVDKGNKEIIKELLRYNCAMNTTSNAKYALRPLTPLQLAMETGILEIIDLLVVCGCRVNWSWLKENRVFPSMARKQTVIESLQKKLSEVPPLLHLTRLSMREFMGERFKLSLRYLKEKAILPNKLIDYLCLKDILDS